MVFFFYNSYNSYKFFKIIIFLIKFNRDTNNIHKTGLIEILNIRNTTHQSTVMRYSPHINGLIAVGMNNGSVYLVNKYDKSCKQLLQQSNKLNIHVPNNDDSIISTIASVIETNKLQSVTDLQFDTLSSIYLLVSYQYYIILWDIEANTQMHIFDKTNFNITSINWLSWTSGNFIVTNSKSTIISIYNVSQKQPIDTIKLSNVNYALSNSSNSNTNNGILASMVIINKRSIWCALYDGTVLLYNLQRHQLEFQSAAGHTETIFDCKYYPHSADILATVSYGIFYFIFKIIK